MTPTDLLRRAGLPDARPERLSGGDMGQVWRCGDHVVKQCADAPPGLFAAEARGLSTLAAAGIRVPEVHLVDARGLVMRWLPPGPEAPKDLGAQIAAAHAVTAPTYGADDPVFLGRFPLPAGRNTEGHAFFIEHRLTPLLRATWTQLGDLGPRLDRLLSHYRPPLEGPRLLHGDLWSGNVLMTPAGAALIDPSVWHGERAVDLAMMALFGGFSPRVYAAYTAHHPIPREVTEALPYYQLYFLLVHVHFFGVSYCRSVEQAIRRCGG
ncbi:MAG: fructosamine kinase family protein [Myxococcales bacterium]|nr:fructosamine kinase family protein [Myxococcales bacterium]